jgi:tetratricopeptide (TPR) repeat protein
VRKKWPLGALGALLLAIGPRGEDSSAARAARAQQSYESWLGRARAADEETPAEDSALPVLELAHDARRRGDWLEALELYESIAWRESDERSRAQAEHWRARALEECGRAEDARKAWESLSEHARDPCERLRACDRVALSLVREGDRAAAERVLAHCIDEISPRALEASEEGDRVSRTLANMRAPTLLGIDATSEGDVRERSAARK